MRAFGLENGLRIAGRPECDPFLPACSLCSSNPVSGRVAASIRVHAIVTSPCKKNENEKEKDAASRVKNKCRR